jgi:hypothetical protein
MRRKKAGQFSSLINKKNEKNSRVRRFVFGLLYATKECGVQYSNKAGKEWLSQIENEFRIQKKQNTAKYEKFI